MSRRYPVKVKCERCGLGTAQRHDGTPKAHTCHFQWSGEPAPYDVVPASYLANRTGVDKSFVEGLMNSGRLRGVKLVAEGSVGAHGAKTRYYFNREDADRIIAAIEASRP